MGHTYYGAARRRRADRMPRAIRRQRCHRLHAREGCGNARARGDPARRRERCPSTTRCGDRGARAPASPATVMFATPATFRARARAAARVRRRRASSAMAPREVPLRGRTPPSRSTAPARSLFVACADSSLYPHLGAGAVARRRSSSSGARKRPSPELRTARRSRRVATPRLMSAVLAAAPAATPPPRRSAAAEARPRWRAATAPPPPRRRGRRRSSPRCARGPMRCRAAARDSQTAAAFKLSDGARHAAGAAAPRPVRATRVFRARRRRATTTSRAVRAYLDTRETKKERRFAGADLRACCRRARRARCEYVATRARRALGHAALLTRCTLLATRRVLGR